MTSIRALPSTYYILTDNMRTNASSRDRMIAGDFQTLLKAQNKTLSSSSDSVKTLSQQKSEENAISQKNVEAILSQLLASRKMLCNSVSKTGRSTPGNLACSDVSDVDEIESEGKDEHIHCHTIRHLDFCWDGFVYSMPDGCVINIPAAPVMYSAYTVIWTPIDIIRRELSRYASSPSQRRHKPRFRFNYSGEKKNTTVYGDDE